MTSPLSRIRSMTSARPLGFGARWTPPDAPLVVSAVLIPLLPAAFPRRIASVRTPPQLLADDALDRDDLPREPLFDEPFDRPDEPFDELDFEELDRLRLDELFEPDDA